MNPCFILAPLSITLGTSQRYIVHVWHNREAFKPTRLYAHLPEPRTFILEKVQWGIHGCEHFAGPIDLYEFGMTHQSVELVFPTLERGEEVGMSIQYTGRVLQGLVNGAQFSVPIIWAEPGASLLRSANATLNYSVE